MSRDRHHCSFGVIQTDPWRYDPATGPKESLIAEVLAALGAETNRSETKTEKAKNLPVRLGKRIDWAKAIKLTPDAVSPSLAEREY